MSQLYKYIAVLFFITTVIFAGMFKYAYIKSNNYHEETIKLKEENSGLKEKAKFYQAQLEKEHNDKVELNRKYNELEAKAKSDQNFNWVADISNSPVINELRK